MSWLARVKGDPLPWLQEPDPHNPAIRYFALRDLFDRPAEDPEARAAHAAIMTGGPIPVILGAQHPDGYWQRPGGGYGKYHGTVWQIMLLAPPTCSRAAPTGVTLFTREPLHARDSSSHLSFPALVGRLSAFHGRSRCRLCGIHCRFTKAIGTTNRFRA